MKKIISILLAMILLGSSMGVFAAKKTQIEEISYDLPDIYVLDEIYESARVYIPTGFEYEIVTVNVVEGALVEEMEEATDSQALTMANAYLSDEIIFSAFAVTGKTMTHKSESTGEVNWSYTESGIKVLEAFATFEGVFDDGKQGVMYAILVIVIHNGKTYLFYDFGDADNNSLEEFLEMANSISFEDVAEGPGEADNTVKITVNDERIYPDSEPVIINGRTLCPIRAIAEKIGFDVEWDPDSRTVKIKNEEREIQLTIGGSKITGYRIQYDPLGLPDKIDIDYNIEVPAQIINDRTYLPVRAVSEALRCLVDWESNTRTVKIETGNYGEKVYLIKETRNYHKQGVYCPFYEINKVLYHTEEYLNDVKIRGYKPCTVCFPEE